MSIFCMVWSICCGNNACIWPHFLTSWLMKKNLVMDLARWKETDCITSFCIVHGRHKMEVQVHYVFEMSVQHPLFKTLTLLIYINIYVFILNKSIFFISACMNFLKYYDGFFTARTRYWRRRTHVSWELLFKHLWVVFFQTTVTVADQVVIPCWAFYSSKNQECSA